MRFLHPWYVAVLLFMVVVGVGVGLVAFIVQVAHWDREYESFVVFPLRLAVYAIGYSFCPIIGFAVGSWMIRSDRRTNRKFGIGSLYVSSVFTCFWIYALLTRHSM